MFFSSASRFRTLRRLHRKGDSGSARVVDSNSSSRSVFNEGSNSTALFLPPPERRIRLSGNTADCFNSAILTDHLPRYSRCLRHRRDASPTHRLALGSDKQAAYLSSMLLDGERKSIEPLATRLPEGNVQAMQQFIGQSPWEWNLGWERLGKRMTAELEPDPAWMVDDTGFPKQDIHSVAVERQ